MATEAKYGSYSSTEQKNLENRYQLELTGKVLLPRSAGIYIVKQRFLFHVSFKELIGHSELLSAMVALTILTLPSVTHCKSSIWHMPDSPK